MSIKNLFATSFFALSGWCRQTLEEYTIAKPELNFKEYFNGPINAWGVLQDHSGKVIKHFTIKMQGEWEGNMGVLTEDFSWSDGRHSKRTWNIEVLTPTHLVARASDAVGDAVGHARGNAMQMRYTLKIPVGKKVHEFAFDDWLYAVDDKVIVNKAKMKKFGFTVGEITLFMQKD